MCYGWTPQQLPNVGFMSLICLFTYCRLEYIKLGSQKDLTWREVDFRWISNPHANTGGEEICHSLRVSICRLRTE